MYYYKIAEVTLCSFLPIHFYEEFLCEPCEADITLENTDELPPEGEDINAGDFMHRQLKDGWFFHLEYSDKTGMYMNSEYTKLRLLGYDKEEIRGVYGWYVRIAIECRLVYQGYVPLHSAAIEVQGEAYAFSGNSGIGKSTRAEAWIEALDATLISGDRPLIDVKNLMVYGVPWDGKEKCFRNVHFPIKAICEVRRSDAVYARVMSFKQRRKLLLRQCFMPMWDMGLAAIQMSNLRKLAETAEMVRVFSGPTAEDARELYRVLQQREYKKEEADMKAKEGFVLRHVVDEYILMPTGDNISKFNGTVLLNEVAAFVWDKLQNPVSKDDILEAMLNEYEVDRETATADLDALLAKLSGYGVIEED